MNLPPDNAEVWIGLAKVRQRPGAGVLLDRNEAYTNVVALANDEVFFRHVVADSFSRLGFDVVTLDEPEPLAQRLEAFTVSDELLRLAQEVRSSGTPRFDTFQTWTANDE